MKLFWIRKIFIFSFVVIICSIVVAVSYVSPMKYNATASIIPPEESSGGGGLSSFLQTISGGISLGGMGQSNKIKLFKEYLHSRGVSSYIADKLDLRNSELFQSPTDELLYGQISSTMETLINKNGILLVSCELKTGFFPDEADISKIKSLVADIPNTAIEGLDSLNRIKSVSKAKRKRIFIEKMLSRKRGELDSVDALLERFQQDNKVLALKEQTQAIVGNAVSIGSELAKAEIELNIRKHEYSPSSPAVKAYQNLVNRLKDQYSRIQSGGIVANDKFSIPLEKIPTLIKVYTNLMRDQKILEQVNLYLETQKYQEAIQEESDIPTVEPLDKAVPPFFKSSPSKFFVLMLSGVISTFLAMILVVAIAFFKGRFYLTQETK